MKMKKIILSAITCSIINLFLSGCNTPTEKLENAKEKANEANSNLDKANLDYKTDVENYRKETTAKIAANDKSIADFKARIESDKQDAKNDYNKKVAELEQKNTDMKKKMDDYQLAGKEKWELFKVEFSHSMDELAKAFKD